MTKPSDYLIIFNADWRQRLKLALGMKIILVARRVPEGTTFEGYVTSRRTALRSIPEKPLDDIVITLVNPTTRE